MAWPGGSADPRRFVALIAEFGPDDDARLPGTGTPPGTTVRAGRLRGKLQACALCQLPRQLAAGDSNPSQPVTGTVAKTGRKPGQFTAAGTNLSGSKAYDPWGVSATTGTSRPGC